MGAKIPEGGVNLLFGQFFLQNYMKTKEMRPGGCTSIAPPPWIHQYDRYFSKLILSQQSHVYFKVSNY